MPGAEGLSSQLPHSKRLGVYCVIGLGVGCFVCLFFTSFTPLASRQDPESLEAESRMQGTWLWTGVQESGRAWSRATDLEEGGLGGVQF